MGDAYQEYVERSRASQVKEPDSPTVELTLDREVAAGLLLLIDSHIGKYGMKDQALLAKAMKRLEEALLREE